MDYYQFMNSKVLFKEVRHKPAGSMAMPVMVHISESGATSQVFAGGCCGIDWIPSHSHNRKTPQSTQAQHTGMACDYDPAAAEAQLHMLGTTAAVLLRGHVGTASVAPVTLLLLLLQITTQTSTRACKLCSSTTCRRT